MQTSITLYELGIFMIFVLILVVGGYTFVTLRNVNGFIKEAKTMLQENKDNFNQIILNIDEISENTAMISGELGKSVGELSEAIKTISHETTDTVLTINETADYVAKYAIVIGEIVKTVISMFSSEKK
ncbi:MAG: hypothetical protein Q7I97_00935 [Thermovirgaceae bacterium]|nr:hypothetical protein [Thermovirgaceae bacterium]